MRLKLEASKDLKKIVSRLTQTTKKNFTQKLDEWYENYKYLSISNTTNALEGGVFSHMKNMISLHRGLSKSLKVNLVDYYLVNYRKK
ncbi:MAG: hypothetical protein ACI9RG_000266 [Sulfurimonas sp.]|jgi:hypothetical protein